MSDKNYREYIGLLRHRPARPPFSDVARLLSDAHPRSAVAFPLLPTFIAVLFIGAAIVGGMFIAGAFERGNDLLREHHSSRNPPAIHQFATSTSQPSVVNNIPTPYHAIRSKDFGFPSHAKSSQRLPVATLSSASDNVSVASDSSTPIRICAPIEMASVFLKADHRPSSSMQIPITSSDDESRNGFFAAIGGAIADQVSSNTAYRNMSFTDGFLGLGYMLSSSSSVQIMGGEDVFIVPSSTTVHAISFHDTTFVHDGTAYQNVLGEIGSTNTPSATRIYWLGASYRYTVSARGFTPYIEALAGGSSDGMIGGAAIGISIIRSAPVTLDAGAYYRALIPLSGATLTTFGAQIEMRYGW